MRKIFLTSLIIFTLAMKNFAMAEEIPPAPTENIYVADFAAMIDDSTKNQILEIGNELYEKYKAQIVIVTVENLNEKNIDEYANELFRNWKIGGSNLNNGVLLLIAKEERRFRIEVGYGLENAITDGNAGEILDNMTSYFRSGDYSTGILQAYGELTRKIYEKYGGAIPANVPEPKPPEEESPLQIIIGMIVGIIIIVIFCFFVKYIITIPIAILAFVVSAIMYFATHGKRGSLNFGKIYLTISESIGFKGDTEKDDDTKNLKSTKGKKNSKNNKKGGK